MLLSPEQIDQAQQGAACAPEANQAPLTAAQIAYVVHEAIHAHCTVTNGVGPPPWDDAAVWQRGYAVAFVEFMLAHPEATAAVRHEALVDDRSRAGWTLGPADHTKKTHPWLLLPYVKLPESWRRQDALIEAIVGALKGNRP